MRDGIVLRGDLYRPEGSGACPVLIQRTPYNKEFLPLTGLMIDPIKAAAHGYAVLIQDVRARWASEGDVFFMYRDEPDDGADTVKWVAAQAWCNGRIGVYGLSYMGATAWMMAAEAPEHVQAIAPTTAPFEFWRNHLWRGGALNIGLLLSWALATIGPAALIRSLDAKPDLPAALTGLIDAVDDLDEWALHTPMTSLPPALPDTRDFIPFFFEILKHNVPDAFTDSLLMKGRHHNVRAPAMIIAGWNDVLLDADLDHFTAMKADGATRQARENTRLIIGPWAHGMFQSVVGELDFGVRASGMFLDMREDLTAMHLRWFDHWLSGAENSVDEEARVKIFIQGKNRWRDEKDWPIARANETSFFFDADGGLQKSEPSNYAAERSYIFDPNLPCGTAGGSILMTASHQRGPVDQAQWLSRPDVLSFTSQPLEEEIEVTGPVRATLFAATSGRDTDWIVKLCDVHPDGRSYNVCDGVIRARFREGFAAPKLLKPNEVYEYTIDLSSTSIVFGRGHRIQVLVTSSDFPRYDRNPNTGQWPSEATVFEEARQTIFCGGLRCSHIVLPIVKDD